MSEFQREQIPLDQVLVPEALPEKHETVDIRIDEPEREGTLESYTLHSPTRKLVLTVYHQDILSVESWIYSTQTEGKLRGETSALYSKAAELMQQLADQEQRPVHYAFSTIFPNLYEWAVTEGREIFAWSFIETGAYKAEEDETPKELRGVKNLRYFNAWCTFLPNKK